MVTDDEDRGDSPPRKPLEERETVALPEGPGSPQSGSANGRTSAGSHSSAAPAPRLSDAQDFGAYRIIRLLGRGGMGEVYAAEHQETGTRVALKLLNQDLSAADGERFLREGRLAASISHPNSVYIYGTDQIDGIPVISMELVSGGTLRDRILKEGPLDPREAVNLILQVAAGLEAAASQGVLHRDVKPANCFIAGDGTCKVGDFGLSISMEADQDTKLTMTGAFLGTPAYASPEQMKAENLDVRTDIYSLGATLYYMLTGRAPFNESNLARLMSRILQEAPRSPREHRREVPQGLARAVLRCLAKDPADRFPDYQELRLALSPFSLEAPGYGTLSARALAGFIDTMLLGFIVWLPSIFMGVRIGVQGGEGSEAVSLLKSQLPELWIMAVLGIALYTAYFSLLEGYFGATLGKALMRVRVVATDRSAVRLPRAALRAAIFNCIPVLANVLYNPLESQLANFLTGISLTGLLFITARRRNGWAAIHDLLSGSRVVRKQHITSRVTFQAEYAEAVPKRDLGQIGPYDVSRELRNVGGERLLLAIDPKLGRRVWIRCLPPGSMGVSESRRMLSRPGRVRWIGGRRRGDEAWDGYEAIPGRSFVEAITRPNPWGLVRQWLIDIAREIESAQESGEALILDLDRIWVGTDGRARILDFTTLASDHSRELTLGAATPTELQEFLYTLARSALEGRLLTAAADRRKTPEAYLPERARPMLDDLGGGRYRQLAQFLEKIEALDYSAARLSRRRRLLPLATIWLMAFPALFVAHAVGFEDLRLAWSNPELMRLDTYLHRLRGLHRTPGDHTPESIEALEQYIAVRFGPRIKDPSSWNTVPNILATLTQEDRLLAEGLLEKYPGADSRVLQRLEDNAAPVIGPIRERARRPLLTVGSGLLGMMALIGILPVAVIGLVSSLLLRGGVLFRLYGIAIGTTSGPPASRLRCLWRGFIVWLPGLALSGVWLGVKMLSYETRSEFWFSAGTSGAVLLVVTIYIAGSIASLWRPARGPQDRFAGTVLVPR